LLEGAGDEAIMATHYMQAGCASGDQSTGWL